MSLQGNQNPLGLLKEALPAPIVTFWCGILRSFLYQPPVGMVTWWVASQWLQRFLFPNNPLALLENPFFLNQNLKRPKSVELDAMDRDYNTLGGVQALALRQVGTTQWMETASVPPQATRWQCAKQSVETLMQGLEASNNNLNITIVLEVRALDSILRWIRDEDLLPTAEQLRTRQESCENQLNTFTSPTQVVKRAVQSTLQKLMKQNNPLPLSLEECRIQYQDTSQQLQDQYEHLGRLQEILLQQPQPTSHNNNQQEHLQACAQWNAQAKALLKGFMKEPPTNMPFHELSLLTSSNWAATEWKSLLEFLHSHSNMRSSSSLLDKLTPKSPTALLPSSLWKLALAKALHHILLPHWPWMKTTTHQVATAVWGIVEFRFYMPLKVIVLDLLNRRPRLLDPAQILNEQASLQNMLRDLGISVDDLSHAEALAMASRLYEQELKNGAVKNMVFGKMVRLLLIQVQQLKAELLQAFQSIDELVDANRLNVSLLAVIPAVLLVRWGSRVVYSILYRLRVRDLTGLKEAHRELTNRLRILERILILAEEEGPLKGVSLGEFVSQEQKYLLLLDYRQPPFPVKQVDSIYKDMQDLLPPGGMDRETQMNLLKLIHEKNADLIKSL
jgi:ATP synthase regulation protein NCA2